MLPSICVVVPTYWTRAGGAEAPGDARYDHPTPLDQEGTLGALLQSLSRLDTTQFYLLVLVGVTAGEVGPAAERRVGELVGRVPGLCSLVVGPTLYRALLGWLDGRGLEDAAGYLGLAHYPRIRNLQLLVPHALGSEAIVGLDDDEIVTDAKFLTKATEPLGRQVAGERVDGLSGFYLQENGSVYLQVGPAGPLPESIFARKALIMNEATRVIESLPGDIVPTPFCFGGNMEFSAELVAQVGFDPAITRGEDIDYLINARMEGKNFFLRKDLRILHRPPAGGSYRDTTLGKLEQDVRRFIYEREKLLASQTVPGLQPVAAAELMPYPGRFLEEDIEEQSVEALCEAGYGGDARALVAETRRQARGAMVSYLDFRQRWPAVMAAAHRSAALRDTFLGAVRGL